ncbi:MAG: carboxypeptidase-like regulatory domain-containing protein [Planctomycetota bacterium]
MSVRFLIVMMLACMTVGCGGETVKRDPVYKVRGVVTYKGKPVSGADVTFNCEEKGRSAFGRTNDAGEYQLTTFANNDGAVAGKHTVAVSKIPIPASTATLAATESEEYAPPGIGKSTDPVKPKSEIPDKYATAATSGLVAQVNADGENVYDFSLE